jgi:hypothetical protein
VSTNPTPAGIEEHQRLGVHVLIVNEQEKGGGDIRLPERWRRPEDVEKTLPLTSAYFQSEHPASADLSQPSGRSPE